MNLLFGWSYPCHDRVCTAFGEMFHVAQRVTLASDYLVTKPTDSIQCVCFSRKNYHLCMKFMKMIPCRCNWGTQNPCNENRFLAIAYSGF